MIRNVKSLKFGPPVQAERREVISSYLCLGCGHGVQDHKRAGLHGIGRMEQPEQARGARDHCIGDRDRCPCRRFEQPHTYTRRTVRMGA